MGTNKTKKQGNVTKCCVGRGGGNSTLDKHPHQGEVVMLLTESAKGSCKQGNIVFLNVSLIAPTHRRFLVETLCFCSKCFLICMSDLSVCFEEVLVERS